MKTKSIFFPIIALIFAALLSAIMPTEAEGALYKDTIRLHILAPSDSIEDQNLKLKVRDALLKEYSQALSEGESKEEAEARLRERLPEIKDFCKRIVTNCGYSYSVDIELSEEWYDTREYDSFTLPRGTYTSLKIIIGEGEGKNWWCVMYPPLCLELATEGAPADDGVGKYTDEEISLVKRRGYNVKFKLLELFSSAFS